MMSGVLFARLVSGRLTVTFMVLSLGAVWLVPAATFTVILAVPALRPVIFTLVPLTSTLAVAVLLDVALITPSPARVTATLSVSEEMFSVTLLFASVRLPAALPMAHVTLLALVLPSDHW